MERPNFATDNAERPRADRTHGKTGLTTAEREELTRFRKEPDSAGKRGGRLRDRAAVKFRFIATEKARHPQWVIPSASSGKTK